MTDKDMRKGNKHLLFPPEFNWTFFRIEMDLIATLIVSLFVNKKCILVMKFDEKKSYFLALLKTDSVACKFIHKNKKFAY